MTAHIGCLLFKYIKMWGMLDNTYTSKSSGFLGPYLIQGPILNLFAEQTSILYRYPEIST